MAESHPGSEAAISENSRHYYCYCCYEEINHIPDDLKCPTCRSDFISEAPDESDMPELLNELPGFVVISTSVADSNTLRIEFESMSLVQAMEQIEAPLLPSSSSSSTSSSSDDTSRSTPPEAMSSNPDGIMNLIRSVLTDMIARYDDAGDGSVIQIVRNGGNYGGLMQGVEDIATELFDQAEGKSGPPPLSEDQLNNLPSTSVTQDQTDTKCTICCEYFTLGDQVKHLGCNHLFHSQCIISWLKLHGTCPLCRKDLSGVSVVQDEDNRVSSVSLIPQPSFPGPLEESATRNSITPSNIWHPDAPVRQDASVVSLPSSSAQPSSTNGSTEATARNPLETTNSSNPASRGRGRGRMGRGRGGRRPGQPPWYLDGSFYYY